MQHFAARKKWDNHGVILVKQKTKIEKRARIKTLILNIFLLITLLSIMVFIMFKSDMFKIQYIEVIGNGAMEKEDIIENSTLYKEENIFRIKTKIAEEKIKELPYIKEVKVKRKLPKTIIIDIVERKEKVLIKTISMYQVIDMEGYVLKHVESKDENLPTLLGLNINNARQGINLFDKLEMPTLVEFLQEGDRLGLLDNMRDIDLETLDNINITLNNGIDIAFGTLNNVKYKLRLLNEILEDLEKKNIKFSKIIMNKGDHPIIITED